MRIDVHLHDANAFLLLKLIKKVDQIMATEAELIASLDVIKGVIDKVSSETSASLARIAELQALLAAAGNTSPAVDAKVAEILAGLQAVDDQVSDSPTP